MSNVAKLKKQAAELEAKKQFDKALAVYVKLLDSFDEYADELDVALFNRVGDLMLRQGNVADAVDYYEKAVDRYAGGGFFNNAIALCNKILRHSPGRASVYYKLGKISAQKGFKNDAKQNFLEYADRMQKAGKIDEAFRALTEFADLCPDQDDIRLMLADQLFKADRKPEAIEQLQALYERYDSEGRPGEAAATLERMRSIDPTVEPRAGTGRRRQSTGDLVFLDLDESPRQTKPTPVAAVPPPPAPTPAVSMTPPAPVTPPSPIAAAPAPLPARETPVFIERASENTPVSLEGVTRIGEDAVPLESTPSGSLLGLESTNLADSRLTTETPTSSLLDIEPTSFGTVELPPVARSSMPTHVVQEEPEAEEEPESAGGELEFILPDEEPEPPATVQSELEPDTIDEPLDFDLGSFTPAASTTPAHAATPDTSSAALEGLPMMDLDVPAEDAPAEEEIAMPTPSVARRSTMVAVQSVEILKASVEGEPQNWGLHRELGEAMLDAGDRSGGIRELEGAMTGADRTGDLHLASAIAEEIARLEPETVRHHQKRVEYAFRINDKSRLIEAYLALGDSLLRADQPDKARTVYQRVLDLAPDDIRAHAALDTLIEPEPEPPPPVPARTSGPAGRRSVPAATAPAAPSNGASSGGDFVNLGDWLRDDESPKDTRMVVQEQEPSGDEEADFADMLRKFKQGVAENVDPEDYQSHYDLAIAYKEMGLLDEAIHEFQKALGSPTNRLPTYEALGQCFIEKEAFKMASSILGRALNEPKASDEQLVGVYYLLGRAAEAQGNTEEAMSYYQRVFVLDIQFRDITDRMSELERSAR